MEVKAAPEVLPLCWWDEDDCARVAAVFRAVWQRWLSEWVPGAHEHEVASCCPAAAAREAREQTWMLLSRQGEGRIWSATASIEHFAARAIFSMDPAHLGSASVASQACREAAAHWGELVAQAFPPVSQQDAPTRDLFRPWSGAVLVTLGSACAPAMRFLLDAPATRSIAGRRDRPASQQAIRPSLAPLPTALDPMRVRLDVVLAECELDVGELCGLRPGDVIPLATALDAPLRVQAGHHTLFDAYLGRRGRVRAIEVASHSPESTLQQP